MQAVSIWGLARKAARVSAAERESSKASAAVLLSAMIRASAERSRCKYSRNRMEFAITMPQPASSSAAELVSMMMTISFCSMRRLRNVVMAGRQPAAGLLFLNGPRNVEELRTDLQSRLSGRSEIDIEAHLPVLNDKGDHAAVV